MADEDLRRLERAAAQGEAGAALRLLRERQRRGEIDDEQIALAAYLGYPAALDLHPDEVWSGRDLAHCLDGLARWGRLVTVAGTYGVARHLVASLPSSGARQVSLTLRGDPGLGTPLRPGVPFVVGRASGVDFQIGNDRVSRRHCELWLQPDGSVMLRDLGSRNGTLVGGQPVQEPTVLQGEAFQIANETLYLHTTPDDSDWSRCLEAIRAWLEAPSPEAARVVHTRELALREWCERAALGAGPGLAHRALLAAAHAVLSEPPCPSHDLLAHGFDLGACRRAIRAMVLPWILSGDFPNGDVDPPPEIVRPGSPQSASQTQAWRDLAAELHERTGLRLQWEVPESSPGRRTYQVRNPTPERYEIVTVFDRGPSRAAAMHRWAELQAEVWPVHPGLAQPIEVGTLPTTQRPFVRSLRAPGLDLWSWREREHPNISDCVRAVADLAPPLAEIASRLRCLYLTPRKVRVVDNRPVIVGLVVDEVARLIPSEDSEDDALTPISQLELHYAAPEQVEGTDGEFLPDMNRTAVYQLALLLYTLLAERPPFRAGSGMGSVMLQILDAPPPRFADLSVSVPAPLEDVIQRALAKAPPDRYADAHAFASALREAGPY